MPTNWPETTKELSAQLKNVRSGAPEVMRAFSALAQAAVAPKALDAKTKELIALAISVRDPVRRLHRVPRQGGGRSGCLARRGVGDARAGDLHGSGPVGDVCEPRARSGLAVRGGAGPQAGVTASPGARGAARAGAPNACAGRAPSPFSFRVDTRGGRSHKHGPGVIAEFCGSIRAVIPGPRHRVGASRRPMTSSAASPESITTDREYGFRAPSLRSVPGMTELTNQPAGRNDPRRPERRRGSVPSGKGGGL
jgi:hypothetical protein